MRLRSCFFFAVLLACSGPAQSGELSFEPFDTNVASDPAWIGFSAAYPALSVSGPGTVAVIDGVLHTTGNGMQVTIPGTVADIIISGDIGTQIEDPGYVAGFVIGQNNIVFRPGSSSPRGSLTVEGPGGFTAQDMGFVPGASTLHQFEVRQFLDGRFEIRVTDGSNSGLAFEATFRNVMSVGGVIGFHRGGAGTGEALFDNLRVALVPEPLPFKLLLPCCLLLGVSRAHRWR